MSTNTYIIDAFNVIHKSTSLRSIMLNSITEAGNSLIAKINNFAKGYPTYKFILVFDGTKFPINIYNTKINSLFSNNKTADELIKSYVNKEQSNNLIVVSSDNEVYNNARINAKIVMTSEDFLKEIERTKTTVFRNSKNKNKEKPQFTTKKDMKEFLEIFGNEN